MPAVIGTNIVALFSQRSLQNSEALFNKAMERLSSGSRINRAADDAAGSAIADRMTAQIRGLNQAVRNANDTISLIKTGEGAMQESAHILQRMRELSVQSASDTNTSADRQYLQKEVSQLQQESTRIAATTEFNQQKILNGGFTAKTFQIGANAGQNMRLSIGDFSADKMGSQRLTLNGSANTAVSGASAAILNTVTDAEDLTLAGFLGTTSINVLNQSTARDVAALVNGVTNTTGVSATALTRTRLDNVSSTGTFTLSLYGKNVSSGVNISTTITNVSDLSNLADAINARMASTGITAELSADKSKVTMIQAEGYDIVVENLLETGGSGATVNFSGLDEDGNAAGAAAALGAAVGTDSGRVTGSVVFSSAESIRCVRQPMVVCSITPMPTAVP